jgi:acyl-homoserine-lactone acylase
MKHLFWLCLFLLTTISCGQPESEDYRDVKIARDQWGVPHIHGKTDVDVVYGLAWAQCEDDFITLQEQLLAAKGMLGEIKGKDGLIVDFAIHFMGLREEVDKRYESDINPTHHNLIQSFVSAINTYASLHPDEVLLDDAFPITDKDLLVSYQLGLVDITGAGKDLQKIMNGTIKNDLAPDVPTGSNAIAISKRRTDNGKTFLAINSHQPLEGWYSWYEAHLCSDEGLNILGGTFPGGFMIFHGVNEHLGWAHTVNHADFSDVYKLRMHEEKKDHYYYDGQVLKLKEKKYWAWMKLLGFIKIPISRSIYESVYGPTFKTDDGYYAWRFVASKGIRMGEQWLAMDKSRNFEEFMTALEMQAIPSTNIVYADKDDNIYFISNAKIPKRDSTFQWARVLPGDTSAILWKEEYYSIDRLPQVLNPGSGYVFNTNNSPYNSSDPGDDADPLPLNKVMNFQPENLYNNRSKKFLALIDQYDRLSYEDFKKIKFNAQYPDTLITPFITNLDLLLNLDPLAYPDIADGIAILNKWDRNTDVGNSQAAFFFFSYGALSANGFTTRGGTMTEKQAVDAITEAKSNMLKKYGTLEVPLGDIQRHIRGKINLPLGGGPDVLAAMYWQETDNNQYKGIAGESYILLAQFDSIGVQLETINAYGSSAESDSPHYTDQMDMYVNRKLKPMSLNISKAFAEAQKVYCPKKIIEK